MLVQLVRISKGPADMAFLENSASPWASMHTTATTMDTGYRWARITPDDHSGAVYIVTFLGFTYGSLTFFTRLLIKWRLLGLDDLAMLAAQLSSVVQFSLLLTALSAGLAKSFDTITEQQYARMSSAYVGTQIMVYMSLGFSKLASILLVRRLFIRDMKNAWAICNIVTTFVILWTVVATVLVSAHCTSESLSPKTPSGICRNIELRYLFVVTTDGITDLMLAFVPTYLCRRLKMSILFKLQVLAIFASRLPVPGLAGLFYRAWKESMHSENPGVDRTTSLVYQQCQLCCSLIASTIPCLKSFIQSFDTGSGQKAGFGNTSHSGGYGHTSTVQHSTMRVANTENYQMECLDEGKRRKSRLGRVCDAHQTIMIDGEMSADIDSASGCGLELGRRSTQDSDQNSQQSTQELVIRKEIHFHVRREPAAAIEAYLPGLLRLPK